MNEIKIYGKSLIYWLISTNVFSILFILALHQTTGVDINKLGDSQKLVSILSYLVGFYFFEKSLDSKANIEIKKTKINFKYIIMYGIILVSLGIIGDYISTWLNWIFKFFGFYFKPDNVSNTFKADSIFGYILLISYACLLAPILEELIFRGYTINLFKKYGKKFAILISAIMFSIMHAEYTQLLPAFMCGILLGIVFFKTNDIRVCILCHIFNNIMALLTMYLNINKIYINLIFIILSIIIIFLFNKSNKFFEITKDIKKEKFEKKNYLCSVSLIIFIIICMMIVFAQLKFI